MDWREYVKCICCGEKIPEYEAYWTSEGALCYACYEYDLSTPVAWVVYFDGSEILRGTIGRYVVLADDSDLEEMLEKIRKAIVWVGHGWRGYYDLDEEILEEQGFARLHTDCILAGSRDAEDLNEFDKRLRVLLEKLEIPYFVLNLRTSNLFAVGYDLIVPKEYLNDLEKFNVVVSKLNELKYHYRDPVRFTLTALTGKDEFDEKDYMLLRAWELIRQGYSVEDVLREVIGVEVREEVKQEV